MLAAVGVNPDDRHETDLHETWISYGFRRAGSKKPPIPVILIEKGPKNVSEVKKAVRGIPACIVFVPAYNTILLKAAKLSDAVRVGSSAERERVSAILQSCGFAAAATEIRALVSVKATIHALQTATRDFDNRGLFENHYLKERIWNDTRIDADKVAESVLATRNVWDALKELGWNIKPEHCTQKIDDTVSITVTLRDDLNVRKSDTEVAPSYLAVDALKHSTWSILTNGTEWRLYSVKVSASTTNYFAAFLDPNRKSAAKYLAAIFGSTSYAVTDGRRDIDVFFTSSREYARDLEDDMATRIMSANGTFLDIVKGILDHDMKTTFSAEDLEGGRRAALTTMYRIWFVLYAESRNLLPIKDKKYRLISLQAIRNSLDDYESRPNDTDCWKSLLKLFHGIRCGSSDHNLPQYDGDLFRHMSQIDGARVRNAHLVSALRGLLERDGSAVDYASLNVRHLGSIYETLMEYGVRQAQNDIILIEEKGKAREIVTKQSGAYSYKKNDLYLASKGGIALRKSTASYYTPDEMVRFLVRRGLEPILAEREDLVAGDLEVYRKDPSEANRRACIDRLLDIQVLDPAMGSGHFLVEALSRITEWATRMLKEHPRHPLLTEIDCDRKTVVEEQQRRGVTIDPSRLADDVLLKRRVMKRCIFGVDLNPLAVDLCKLSLWLDSFAIGVPLTYLNHHIKHGDSTIGMWRADMASDQDTALDAYMAKTEKDGASMTNIINSADVTVDAVHSSEDAYSEYEKKMAPHRAALDALTAFVIDKSLLPKKTPKLFARKLGQIAAGTAKPDEQTQRIRDRINQLRDRYSFFHWELEMMDAFADERRGFDCVVGNFPWDKSKANVNEFFAPYDQSFASLKLKPEISKRIARLCKDQEIAKEYEEYRQGFSDKSTFYKTYDLQGTGDRDLWQLVLERVVGKMDQGVPSDHQTRRLVSDCGTVSILLPSGLLTGRGAMQMRDKLLDWEIRQLYVFENKGIFPILSSYRFLLLTVRNRPGPDEFPAAFYLHNPASLEDASVEREKFSYRSKKRIRSTQPDDLVISEVTQETAVMLEKVSKHSTLISGLADGWDVQIARGLDRANDADLFRRDGKGWPVVEGKSMHQFNHAFASTRFTILPSAGLKRLASKRAYHGRHRDFYDSYQLVFRNIARSTDLRTVFASIIPPHTFYPNSLYAIMPLHNGVVELSSTYNRNIAYLAGVLNSMTFDFMIRSKVNTNVASVIKNTPIPDTQNPEIATLAAKLSVGTDEFEAFAEAMRVPNTALSPPERIRACTRLDALVAIEYEISRDEYVRILNSFKFREDSSLLEAEEADWRDHGTLRGFFGEVRKLAPAYYDEISGRAA